MARGANNQIRRRHSASGSNELPKDVHFSDSQDSEESSEDESAKSSLSNGRENVGGSQSSTKKKTDKRQSRKTHTGRLKASLPVSHDEDYDESSTDADARPGNRERMTRFTNTVHNEDEGQCEGNQFNSDEESAESEEHEVTEPEPKKRKGSRRDIAVASASSGSRTSTLTPEECASLKSEVEELRRQLRRATSKMKRIEEHNEFLKSESDFYRATSRKKTSTNKKGVNEAVSQMLRRVRNAVNMTVLRYVKFKEPNWDVWSLAPNSVCGMLQPYLSWPTSYTPEHKVEYYYQNIQPYLGEILIQQRNLTTQALRQGFNSEFVHFIECDRCYLTQFFRTM